MKDLVKERRKLQSQVDHIIEMIDDSTYINDTGTEGLRIESLSVKVFDVSNDAVSARSSQHSLTPDKSNGSSHIFRSQTGWPLNFALHIHSSTGAEKTELVITKHYEAFAQLNNLLMEQFLKVKKLAFPSKPKSGYSGWSTGSIKLRVKLASDLENWLGLLLSDEIVRESALIRDFLLGKDLGLRSQLTVERRRSSYSIIKSAGNLMKSAGKLAIKAPFKMAEFVDGFADNIGMSLDAADSSIPPSESNSVANSTVSQEPRFSERADRSKSTSLPDQLSKSDLGITLECVFSTIEEAFNLSHPNQWVRQKGLQLVKRLLRRTYGETIARGITTKLSEIKSPERLASVLRLLDEKLWPGNIWFKNPEIWDNRYERTDQEKLDTKLEAKKLFVYGGLLPTESLSHIVGRYNTVNGLTRIFNMFQDQNLNRVLICMLLDNIIRCMFDSQ